MLELGEHDRHLLELLNPFFCAFGRADHVELQIGKKRYIKVSTENVVNPKRFNYDYYIYGSSK